MNSLYWKPSFMLVACFLTQLVLYNLGLFHNPVDVIIGVGFFALGSIATDCLSYIRSES